MGSFISRVSTVNMNKAPSVTELKKNPLFNSRRASVSLLDVDYKQESEWSQG